MVVVFFDLRIVLSPPHLLLLCFFFAAVIAMLMDSHKKKKRAAPRPPPRPSFSSALFLPYSFYDIHVRIKLKARKLAVFK